LKKSSKEFLEVGRNRARLDSVAKQSLIELTFSYRIPLVESVIAIIAYVSAISVFIVAFQTLGMNVSPGDPLYNGTEMVLEYQQTVNTRATMSYVLALSNCWIFFTIFIPLFFAFTFARTFEDGTLRTFLTYPIDRTTLLVVKMVVSVAVVSVPTAVIPLLWITAFFPPETVVSHLGIVCVSMILSTTLIVATSLVLSVASKDGASTAVVGVLLWTGLSSLSSLPTMPPVVLMVASPIRMVSNYVAGVYEGMLYSDLFLLLLGSLAVTVMFCIIAVGLFRRQDI
jgi:ABC-type transport system involved in multi-copper enzyme maturation permease subunit